MKPKSGKAAAAGFTDANAKWLTPTSAAAKVMRGMGRQRKADSLSSTSSGSDSDDKPLPGELSDGDDSLRDVSDSDAGLDAIGTMQGLSNSSDDDQGFMDMVVGRDGECCGQGSRFVWSLAGTISATLLRKPSPFPAVEPSSSRID